MNKQHKIIKTTKLRELVNIYETRDDIINEARKLNKERGMNRILFCINVFDKNDTIVMDASNREELKDKAGAIMDIELDNVTRKDNIIVYVVIDNNGNVVGRDTAGMYKSVDIEKKMESSGDIL